MLLPWVYLSAGQSITSRRSLKMAKHTFTKTTPHNSLVIFWCQKYLGEIPVMLSKKQMAPNASGVRKISNFWNVTYMPTSQPESPARGLQSSPPACTASVTVGSSKAPWPWLWPWIGSRTQGHINIHSTCRTTSLPNRVLKCSTEIWPFEFREISTFGEV